MSEERIVTADGLVRIFPESGSFTWNCPTCGRGFYGKLGPEPVGGWEAPVWKLTEGPTLSPSLGCQGMRDDSPGNHHWFLRDGKLVVA